MHGMITTVLFVLFNSLKRKLRDLITLKLVIEGTDLPPHVIQPAKRGKNKECNTERHYHFAWLS